MQKVQYEHDIRIAAIHKLRVNLKSLAFEAKAIRHEERRAGIVYRSSLREHRVGPLREEIRYTGLALAFVRNRPYRRVENVGSKELLASRLVKKILGKIPNQNVEQIEQWITSMGVEQ